MYLNTVMKLVSLSSTSFSVIPFADFFSRLSQYFASCTETTGGTWPGQNMCEQECGGCVWGWTHQFWGFTDGLGFSKVHYWCQSLRGTSNDQTETFSPAVLLQYLLYIYSNLSIFCSLLIQLEICFNICCNSLALNKKSLFSNVTFRWPCFDL